MKKAFLKTVLISFSFWYAVFSTSMPLAVLAEMSGDDGGADVETVNVLTEEPSGIGSEQENNVGDGMEDISGQDESSISVDGDSQDGDSGGGDVLLETGDAEAGATAVSDANSAETEVPGSLEGSNCGGPETDCATDTEVDTEQVGNVETDSDAQADTGENDIEASGSADLDTGDAGSQATSVSTGDTNVVDLENSQSVDEEIDGDGVENPIETQGDEEIVGSEVLPSPTPLGIPDPEVLIEIDTEQDATSEANSNSESVTGDNEVQAERLADVQTGDATAVANSINTANINLVSSDFVWLVENILGQQETTINFYDLILSILQNSGGNVSQDVIINTEQTSDLVSSTSASSNTGENNVEGGTVGLTTGDAVAVANTINLTNLNLVGTNGVFAILNIVGTLVGDIIIPNFSHLNSSDFPWGNVNIITEQNADVESRTSSVSTTGENDLEGLGNMTTGDATSISNTYSFANLVKIGDNWRWVIFNLYGNWDGYIENLEGPGEDSKLQNPGTYEFYDEWQGDFNEDGSNNGGGSLTINTTQDARVVSETSANSNTGNNDLNGNGRVITGDAFSMSSNFTLANMVGVGGSMIFGIFNIIGNWFGNFIVAYPDLSASITDGLENIEPGSQWKYQMTITNNGDAWARGVKLSYNLPGDFVSDAGNADEVDLGNIGPGESVNYQVEGTASSTALAGSELLASASVGGSDTEEGLDNNKASDTTIVFVPEVSNTGDSFNSGPQDHTLPKIAVSVWNNVNEFVYPGDTVLAAITVTNQSPVIAKGVKVMGDLSNDHPMPAIPMFWKLGDLKPGERVIIQFGIGLIKNLPGGEYHLAAEAFGANTLGEEVSSGRVVSNFNVFLKKMAGFLSTDVKAEEPVAEASGEILGLTTDNSSFDFHKYLPYLLGASVLALLLISGARRKLQEKPILPAFIKRRKDEDE